MEFIKKYYRLWDTQTDRFMSTGYNAKGKEDLCECYADYKSNDWDNDECEDESETMWGAWKVMTIKDKIDFIESDEFEIESSFIKFKEQQ